MSAYHSLAAAGYLLEGSLALLPLECRFIPFVMVVVLGSGDRVRQVGQFSSCVDILPLFEFLVACSKIDDMAIVTTLSQGSTTTL